MESQGLNLHFCSGEMMQVLSEIKFGDNSLVDIRRVVCLHSVYVLCDGFLPNTSVRQGERCLICF